MLETVDQVIEKLYKICAIIIKAEKFKIAEEETKNRFLELENVEETIK